MTKEQAFAKFVRLYDIEVPEEQVQNLYEYFLLQAKHNMQYDTLINGTVHLHKAQELAEIDPEIREAAYKEAKADLVMKELIKKLDPQVTEEDLQAKADEIARKDGTPMELVKRFFGQDLAGLTRSVQEDKVKEYILEKFSESK
ncbi:MAG: hypothetical protein IIZ65_01855 [Clostridia bacterium]|nr:hypothetical protein [Clostridia bacterium]